MEVEDNQTMEEVKSGLGAEILGNCDINIVIEELKDNNEHAEAKNEDTDAQNGMAENDGDIDEENIQADEEVEQEETMQADKEEVEQGESIPADEEVEQEEDMQADKEEVEQEENMQENKVGEVEDSDDGVAENAQIIEENNGDNSEEMVEEKEAGETSRTNIIKDQDEIEVQIIEKDPVKEEKAVKPVVAVNGDAKLRKEQVQETDENKENGGAQEPNNNSIKKSISLFGAPVQKKEKGMFKVVQTEKCAACQKTVYAMEKLEMNGHIYHKNCFKCSHCSARLTAKTFSMNEGVIYCVNHFKQLFARKGNYDEGFGRQQYKKKWQGEKTDGATA